MKWLGDEKFQTLVDITIALGFFLIHLMLLAVVIIKFVTMNFVDMVLWTILFVIWSIFMAYLLTDKKKKGGKSKCQNTNTSGNLRN